jgi:hypothetical protein
MKRLSESSPTVDLLDALLKSPTFEHQSRDPWPITHLENALRAILEQKQVELRITFFLDALDEFDGPPDYISRFVKYLVKRPTGSLTYTKVCFSSRPWDDFITNFSTEPKLAVEDFTREDIRYFCTTNLGDTLEADNHYLVPRLADDIVIRASGVFLWASLILKELMGAFSGGQTPSLEDLLQLLQSVPNELSNYYHFIIQRIPKNVRWKTYALLEAVVRARSQEELRLEYLWKTIHISDSLDYPAAQQKLRNLAPRGYEDFRKRPHREILLWGGGLVSAPSGTVQLMHQTVYEFVTKLDFKDEVLGSMSKATHENGHTFHFKSVLTFRLNEELSATWPRTRDALRPSMNHGAEAEETTGRSCQPFLDSVPDHTISNLGIRLLGYLKYDGGYLFSLLEPDLIRSPLAFATFFRLRLYLQDRVLIDPGYLNTIAASEDLLRLVVIAIGLGDLYTHQRLLSTASFLLENGYDKSRIWTLFPHVLEPELHFCPHPSDRRDTWDPSRHSHCLQTFDHLAILFLEHDRRCTSRNIPVDGSEDNWVKPIHAAPPLTMCWLLEHGANPNEPGRFKGTPLDHLSKYKRHITDFGNTHWNLLTEVRRRIYHCASILLHYGGRGHSDDDWTKLLEAFRKEGFDLSNFPGRVPKVEATSTKATSTKATSTTNTFIRSEKHAEKQKSTFSQGMRRLFGKWRQK